MTKGNKYPIIIAYQCIIMDYKPYSVEWNRKRYLAEAMQKYFDDEASVDVVVSDIVDILEGWEYRHRSFADKFQEVLSELRPLMS